MVPEFDERAAAKHAGIPWTEYRQLDLADPMDRWERACIVAFYYLENIIQRHVADAQQAHQRQKQAKQSAKKGRRR
ncbi:MAG: hypothetical protein ACOC9T_01130 [Myxococcota bacterium]